MSGLEDEMEAQLRLVGLHANMVREHRFTYPRRWRFDFAWPGIAVALEVEGGSWIGGGHNRGKDFERNAEKYNEAAIKGWCVIRVTTTMVQDGRALDAIERAVTSRIFGEVEREITGRDDG